MPSLTQHPRGFDAKISEITSMHDISRAIKTLHVKNLPRGFTRALLVDIYGRFGEIEYAQIAKGRGPFGFVRFREKAQADIAMAATRAGQVMHGNRILQAFWAKVPGVQNEAAWKSPGFTATICASPDASTVDGHGVEDSEEWHFDTHPHGDDSDAVSSQSSRQSLGAYQHVGPMAVCPHMKPDRTLLIAHFPRECYENDDIRTSMVQFGPISRINLISDPETKKPKCYGFVEFMDHNSAASALEASVKGQVVLFDQRSHPWHVKAEWTRAYASHKTKRSTSEQIDSQDENLAVDKSEHQKLNGGPMAPSRTLLIAYFPREATKDEIYEALNKHGPVSRVHLIVEKDTKKPKCYGFVEFHTQETATHVLAASEAGAVTMLDSRDHMWHIRAERVRAFDKAMNYKQKKRQGKKEDLSVYNAVHNMPAYESMYPEISSEYGIPPAHHTNHIAPPPQPMQHSRAYPGPIYTPYPDVPLETPHTKEAFDQEVNRVASTKVAEMMANLLTMFSKPQGPLPHMHDEFEAPAASFVPSTAVPSHGELTEEEMTPTMPDLSSIWAALPETTDEWNDPSVFNQDQFCLGPKSFTGGAMNGSYTGTRDFSFTENNYGAWDQHPGDEYWRSTVNASEEKWPYWA